MSFTKAGKILVESQIAESAKNAGFRLGKGTDKQYPNGLLYKLWEYPEINEGYACFSVAETYLGVFADDEDIFAYVDFFWFNNEGGTTRENNKNKVVKLLSSHPEWFADKKYELWGRIEKDNEQEEFEFRDVEKIKRLNSFTLTAPIRKNEADVKNDLQDLLEILKEYNPPKGNADTGAGAEIFDEDASKMKDLDYSKYITLLKDNHNLILHGAPGTGKTHLAKKIAMAMGAKWRMVQFHPSYDYTDFVEGLRPTSPDSNGQIGFELKDGVFKSFCSEALPQKESNFENLYTKFLESLEENPDKKFKTKVKKCEFRLQRNSKDGLYVIPCTEIGTKMPLTKNLIRDYVENGNIRDWKSYLTVVGDAIKGMDKAGLKSGGENTLKKDYVFIIDEINRGDMSKILGELFYSIDPGYRGTEGRVKTQYANMAESSPNDFDIFLQNKKLIDVGDNGYFFIPENVYIIGTMNDIDRSVESMDFAMRRRFAFEEVTAEQSAENFKLSGAAKDAMSRLNAAISKVPGLNSSYHIGAAYFKDFSEDSNLEQFWNRRLKGLLTEYLRGTRSASDELEKLKGAFMTKPAADQSDAGALNSGS